MLKSSYRLLSAVSLAAFVGAEVSWASRESHEDEVPVVGQLALSLLESPPASPRWPSVTKRLRDEEFGALKRLSYEEAVVKAYPRLPSSDVCRLTEQLMREVGEPDADLNFYIPFALETIIMHELPIGPYVNGIGQAKKYIKKGHSIYDAVLRVQTRYERRRLKNEYRYLEEAVFKKMAELRTSTQMDEKAALLAALDPFPFQRESEDDWSVWPLVTPDPNDTSTGTFLAKAILEEKKSVLTAFAEFCIMKDIEWLGLPEEEAKNMSAYAREFHPSQPFFAKVLCTYLMDQGLYPHLIKLTVDEVIKEHSVAAVLHKHRREVFRRLWPGLTDAQVSRFSELDDVKHMNPKICFLYYMDNVDDYRKRLDLSTFLLKELRAELASEVVSHVSSNLKRGYALEESLKRAPFCHGFFTDNCDEMRKKWDFTEHGSQHSFLRLMEEAANLTYDKLREDYEKGVNRTLGFRLAIEKIGQFAPPHPLIQETLVLRKLYYDAIYRRMMGEDRGWITGRDWIGNQVESDRLVFIQNVANNKTMIANKFAAHMTQVPYEQVKRGIDVNARLVWYNCFGSGLVGDSEGAERVLTELMGVEFVLWLQTMTDPYSTVLKLISNDFKEAFTATFGFWYQHLYSTEITGMDMLTPATVGAFGEGIAKHMLEKRVMGYSEARREVYKNMLETRSELQQEYTYMPYETIKDLAMTKVLGISSCSDPTPAGFNAQLAKAKALYPAPAEMPK